MPSSRNHAQPPVPDSRLAPLYYAAVVASLPMVLFVLELPCDTGGATIFDCNRAACAATGYTREELIGTPITLVSTMPLDEDDQRAGLECMRRGEAWRFTSLRRHRDGTIVHVTVQCSLMSFEGRELVVAVEVSPLAEAKPLPEARPSTEHEVSEQRRAEDELAALNVDLEHRVRERTIDLELTNRALRNEIDDRERAEASLREQQRFIEQLNEDLGRSSLLLSTIVDSLDDGLALVDRHGMVLMANQALAGLYQTSLERILGRPWHTVCHVTPPLLARTFQQGGPVTGQERITRPDGTTIVVELRTFPLVNADGSAGQVVLHLMDISERLQFGAVAIQNERLAASSRLAAIVAHEVNSPLQVIQNLLFLAASEDSAERATYLRLIAEEIDRIGGLLHRLLELNRPGDMEYRPNSVNALVEKVLSLTGTTLSRHQVVVRCDLTADLPAVLARGDHLTQVLLNLVLNALDAMPRGGSLQVRTLERAPRPDDALAGPPPERVVVVEVCDTGDGIAPEILPRIFEPFFTTKANGSGLGLAISSQIVEQHGGRLTACSREPRGAVFTIVLPAFSSRQALYGAADLNPISPLTQRPG